jgi:hypothetical protein
MMNDDQIIEMAKQAGCTEDIVAVTCRIYGFRTAELLAFARLIAAATKEEDAAICDERMGTWVDCAAAIRKGGE